MPQAIIEPLDDFLAHIKEARARGILVRSHPCSSCGAIISVEFPRVKRRQTGVFTCPCGSDERVVYTPVF